MVNMRQFCTTLLIVIVALSLLEATGAICNILFQQQLSNDVICPSESLLLKCRVKDKFGGLACTIWKAGANCTLVLPHVLVNRNRTDECESGMFEAQLRSRPTRNCYISILRTTETPEHGTVIACLGPTESNMVDNYTVNIAGRPAAPKLEIKDIREGNTTETNRVAINWTSDGVRLSHHVISVSPPPPEEPCSSGTCLVDPQVTEFELMLNQNQNYVITVRTDNCGDSQQGDTSDHLQFRLEVPSPPVDCKFEGVYNGTTGRLTHIEATWTPPPNPEEQAALRTPIMGYSVTAEHTVVGTQETIDAYDAKTKSNCDGVCSHTINIHPDLSSTSSFVTGKVAAVNSVGTGSFCQGPHDHINVDVNAIASVDTKGLGVEKWTVDFRFHTTRAKPPYHHCTFMYGTDSSYSNLPYCVECSNDTHNGIFTVHLAGDLMSKGPYFYQAIIDENRVQGTFRIDPYYCPLEELAETFEWDIETDAKCNDSHSSLRIPNGVICINDTIPTYEVQYICDEHYTLFPEWQNSSRVCMTNQHWSGGRRTCEKEGAMIGLIIGMAIVAFLLVACAIGACVITTVTVLIKNQGSVLSGCKRCLNNNSDTQK